MTRRATRSRVRGSMKRKAWPWYVMVEVRLSAFTLPEYTPSAEPSSHRISSFVSRKLWNLAPSAGLGDPPRARGCFAYASRPARCSGSRLPSGEAGRPAASGVGSPHRMVAL